MQYYVYYYAQKCNYYIIQYAYAYDIVYDIYGSTTVHAIDMVSWVYYAIYPCFIA